MKNKLILGLLILASAAFAQEVVSPEITRSWVPSTKSVVEKTYVKAPDDAPIKTPEFGGPHRDPFKLVVTVTTTTGSNYVQTTVYNGITNEIILDNLITSVVTNTWKMTKQ
jgi:hypothetical protein